MLLQETKIPGRKMEEILNKIEPKYECMTIDANGSAGGIAILWNPTKITTDYWIGMKRIFMGKFRLIGNNDWFASLGSLWTTYSNRRRKFPPPAPTVR